jgi:hypothetical protein
MHGSFGLFGGLAMRRFFEGLVALACFVLVNVVGVLVMSAVAGLVQRAGFGEQPLVVYAAGLVGLAITLYAAYWVWRSITRWPHRDQAPDPK